MPRRRAFTLINLMVSIAVIAAVGGVAVVTLAPDDRARAIGAASVLSSDIEHAQMLSLLTPDDPVVVRFDPDNEGYWLERSSAPNEAILRSDGSPYAVAFGVGDAATLAGVDLTVASEDPFIKFDAFGRLTTTDNAVFQLAMGDESVWLVASSSTGFVSTSLEQPMPPDPEEENGGELEGGGGLGGDAGGGGGLGGLLGGLLGR